MYTVAISNFVVPAESTAFALVINVQTARSLCIEVSPMLLAPADKVIE